MKQAKYLKVKYNPPSKSYAVHLSANNDKNVPIPLTIPVGTEAANTISMASNGNSFPRPFTHDILLDIINNLDFEISKVIISDIKNGTIFSKIILNKYTQKNHELVIDCRPSDAIIIAIKSGATIFIEDHVMQKLEHSDIDILTYTNSDNISNNSDELVENLHVENLHSDLEKAINNEEYEIAAKIRDKIKKIDKKLEK